MPTFKERKDLVLAPEGMKADMEGRTLSAYFATWDLDRVRDVILPGAFSKTFTERGPRVRGDGKMRSKIKIGLNHQDIVGLPIRLWEDSKGAGYEAKIDPTPVGDLVIARVLSGSLDSNSFTYDVLDSEFDAKENIRYLKELRVYEAGPVDEPCNPEAEIIGLKSFLQKEDPDTWLRLLMEMKAGRPLSAASLALLDNAIASLTELRAKAGDPAKPETPPPDLEPDDGDDQDEQKALADALRGLRLFRKG